MSPARTNPVSRAIAGASLHVARHPKRFVAVFLLLTLLLGAGTFWLTFSNDFREALPKDEPNAMAARTAADGFESFFNSIQVVFALSQDIGAVPASAPSTTPADGRSSAD